jgi:ATP-binding cassette subfamily B (MDR/TAP) protein 1
MVSNIEVTRLSADDAHSVTVGASPKQNNKKDEKEDEKKPDPNAPMVPFTAMFRFYGFEEKVMLAVGAVFCMIGGASFPVINVAFGELLDSTASLDNVEETTKRAVLFMVGVAAVLGSSLFLGFGLVSWAAVRGAKNVRREYMKAMVAQDVAFFDAALAGELSAAKGRSFFDSSC